MVDGAQVDALRMGHIRAMVLKSNMRKSVLCTVRTAVLDSSGRDSRERRASWSGIIQDRLTTHDIRWLSEEISGSIVQPSDSLIVSSVRGSGRTTIVLKAWGYD